MQYPGLDPELDGGNATKGSISLVLLIVKTRLLTVNEINVSMLNFLYFITPLHLCMTIFIHRNYTMKY